MKRGYLIGGLSIALATLLIIIIYPSSDISNELFYSPLQNVNCSNESIIASWDSIFKESSANTTIVKNAGLTFCGAFKNRGNDSYLMYHSIDNSVNYNITQVYATYLNLTTETSQIANNINDTNGMLNFLFTAGLSQGATQPRELVSYSQAEAQFNANFEIIPGNWSNTTTSAVIGPSDKVFYFGDNIFNNNDVNNSETGYVIVNKSIDSFNQIIFKVNQQVSCAPNWTATNTSCLGDDSYIIWYYDAKSCNNSTGRPSNVTRGCDYNQNGIIGNDSTITKEGINVNVYINSNALNNSLVYNSTQKVELREGSLVRVSFNYLFSSALDLKNVRIKKQSSSSSYGYLIVNGLNITKNITIDRVNISSSAVCVKNMEIDSISEISSNCNSTQEYRVNCPGSNSSFTCNRNNNTFTVSGLTNSAVKEITGSVIVQSCTENWICTEYGACQNSIQTRVCTDSNNCGTVTSKPSVMQGCFSCNPVWSCGNWTPVVCPKNETRNRICTDSNNCGSTTGKPSEVQTCVYKQPTYFIIIIVVMIVISIIVVVYLLIRYIKRREPEPSMVPDNPYFKRSN